MFQKAEHVGANVAVSLCSTTSVIIGKTVELPAHGTAVFVEGT